MHDKKTSSVGAIMLSNISVGAKFTLIVSVFALLLGVNATLVSGAMNRLTSTTEHTYEVDVVPLQRLGELGMIVAQARLSAQDALAAGQQNRNVEMLEHSKKAQAQMAKAQKLQAELSAYFTTEQEQKLFKNLTDTMNHFKPMVKTPAQLCQFLDNVI